MAIELDDAREAATALEAAARAVSIPQLRYALRKQAKDWLHCVQMLDTVDDEDEDGDDTAGAAIIEIVGAVVPGMLVIDQWSRDRSWAPVLRSFAGNGGWSLHVDDERDPRGRYMNFVSAASPVVVAR